MTPPPIPIIVTLPTTAQVASTPGQARTAYFEASRDNVVDREGEIVAVDALWASRDLMLSQGDLDIAHWSHLPNPQTGRPDPCYRIGHPTDIRRTSESIWVKGDIFNPNTLDVPTGSSSDWANKFYHSIAGQTPPAKWFPSVYGNIPPDGVDYVKVNGVYRRKVIKAEWFSVGFALRAQHPLLPPVSLTPMGAFAKAAQVPGTVANAVSEAGLTERMTTSGALHFTWGQFAKAVGEGLPVTDMASLRGIDALRVESIEKNVRQLVQGGQTQGHHYHVAKAALLKLIKAGKLRPELGAVTKAFEALGYGHDQAVGLLRELGGKA